MEARHNHKFLILALIVLTMVSVSVIKNNSDQNLAIIEQNIADENIRAQISTVDVVAHAVSVYDITLGKEIYGKNSTEMLPLASLAKTMTVTQALHGRDLSDTVVISGEAVNQTGDHGLRAGERWKLRDLAKLTLVASVNDAAFALGEGKPEFVTEMNLKSKRIGMEHSFFLNKTGLDINPAQPGAYASALDANLLATYALRAYPEIFSVTSVKELDMTSDSGFSHEFKNTNIILDKIPNLVFSKTGYTELAGGNLTVVFRNKENHLIAVTVLGSTFEERFSDMEKLVETLYNI